MKKWLLLILLCFVLLCGFESNEQPANLDIELGRTNMEQIQNKSIKDFEGELIRAINIPNDNIKQYRIYGNLDGCEELVTGGTEDNGIGYWSQYTNWYVYDQLPERDQKLWDNLDTVYFPYLLTDKEYDAPRALNIDGFSNINDLYNSTFRYLYCHPQLYFLRPYLYGYSGEKTYSIEIRFYDKFKSGEERAKATVAIENILNDWEYQVCCYRTELDRAKKIHDLICNKVSYDMAVANNNYDWENDPNFSQSIYSVLCTDITVCVGYAKTFSCVANSINLKNAAISGSGHAWDMAEVDNNWFYIDATWDDSSSNYRYFLCGAKEFLDSAHGRSSYWNFLPNPTDNYRGFVVRDGCIYYGDNNTPFNYGFIDYQLGGNNINSYQCYQLFALPTYSTKNYTLPNSISRTGYKLDYWSVNGEEIKKIKKTNKNTLVSANWKPITYNVNFVKNGKDAKGKMIKIKGLEYDSVYVLSQNKFVRPGYTFLGWSTNKNDSVPMYKDGASVKNLTEKNNKTVKLFAIWEKN